MRNAGHTALLAVQYNGQGSPGSIILIKSLNRFLETCSWHESAEFTSRFATCDHIGLRLDRKVKRLEFLRASDINYLFFRLVWNELRIFTNRLIPRNGNVVARELSLLRTDVIDETDSVIFSYANHGQ